MARKPAGFFFSYLIFWGVGGGLTLQVSAPLFYLYTPCFCGAQGCRPILSATATPAFSQDGRTPVSVLRPKSRPPDEPCRTKAALRSAVVLRGVSRQPVDTGPAAIPVWCGCPVFPMSRYPAAVRTVSGLFLSAFVLLMSRFGMNRPDVVAWRGEKVRLSIRLQSMIS